MSPLAPLTLTTAQRHRPIIKPSLPQMPLDTTHPRTLPPALPKTSEYVFSAQARAGFKRIDPLIRFLTGCRRPVRRQNQALSVFSLGIGFLNVLLLIMSPSVLR